jgi:hypothetical protein
MRTSWPPPASDPASPPGSTPAARRRQSGLTGSASPVEASRFNPHRHAHAPATGRGAIRDDHAGSYGPVKRHRHDG